MIGTRLNVAQRIVVVTALGFSLFFIGEWWMTVGRPTGWVAFAPGSATFGPGVLEGLHPWVQLLIWLVLVAVWCVSSVLILRTPHADSSQAHTSQL